MRQLSELEGICLGIAARHRPCTAYRVRRELLASPSSHWQASAGSVYPLLARLEDEGLIASSIDPDDGRGRRLLRVSRKGMSALRHWIMAGRDAGLVASVTDPIRSRVFFLKALSESDRRRYLDDVIALTESFLGEARANVASEEATDDVYAYFGSLGAMKVTEARLDWLRQMRTRLLQP